MTTKMGKWKVKENVIEDSKKYKRRSDWMKNSSGGYQSARINGWLDECFPRNA